MLMMEIFIHNTYTYQRGNNEYYSKDCYFFMIKGRMANLQQLQSRNSYYKKKYYRLDFRK